jgi:hypothetical protein
MSSIYLIKNSKLGCTRSVADPHHFEADSDKDPAFHFDAIWILLFTLMLIPYHVTQNFADKALPSSRESLHGSKVSTNGSRVRSKALS